MWIPQGWGAIISEKLWFYSFIPSLSQGEVVHQELSSGNPRAWGNPSNTHTRFYVHNSRPNNNFSKKIIHFPKSYHITFPTVHVHKGFCLFLPLPFKCIMVPSVPPNAVMALVVHQYGPGPIFAVPTLKLYINLYLIIQSQF